MAIRVALDRTTSRSVPTEHARDEFASRYWGSLSVVTAVLVRRAQQCVSVGMALRKHPQHPRVRPIPRGQQYLGCSGFGHA
jgi:hypothetical protein